MVNQGKWKFYVTIIIFWALQVLSLSLEKIYVYETYTLVWNIYIYTYKL